MTESDKGRYQQLLEAIDWERKAEESFFKNLQSKKTLAEKVDAGILWYPTTISKKYYTIGEQVEIIIERRENDANPHRFKSGNGCEVFYVDADGERQSFKAVTTFVRKNRMGILFGSQVSHVDDIDSRFKLGVELVYDEKPYTVMTQAINELINSTSEHIKTLRKGIQNQDTFDTSRRDPNHSFTPWTKLNESQNQAIEGCLQAESIAIIHGPPGTGKTTTLAALIKEILKQEKRVLVCAPSNNATDLLARRLDSHNIKTLRLGNTSRITDSTAHLTFANQVTQHDEWKHIKKVRIEAGEARKQANTFKRKFGHKERENRSAMYKESRELHKWAKELEQRLIESILFNAQAVCTTLISASHRHLQDMQFDTVIIDEASQAMEPECWNAILKAKRVIFAGDHLQLPPTVKSKEALSLGLETTLLDQLTDRIHHSYLLDVQYRMNEKILSFSNKYFYESQLKTAEDIKHWSIDDYPLSLIDTSGCGFEEKRKADSFSPFNDGEVFILNEWFTRHRSILTSSVSIGIISPYAAQVKQIKESIEKEDIYRDLDIEVNSVDGFQGQEKDVIIISLVRSNERSEIGFLADERRLNVAMTRARKKLVLLGDMATLGAHTLFVDLAEHIETHGLYQSAWEYMA